MNPLPLLVDPEPLPWSPERRAAAMAVAAPNQARVARAALDHLCFGADGDDFSAWCDAEAPIAGSAPTAQGRVQR
ncbi:MAG: hypothetical protein M3Y32_14875 [Pseudomonadota bacterium]|nr:hypothetical protein [Pseudomonadota bacterium]